MVRLLAYRIVDANGERRTGRREQASVFVVVVPVFVFSVVFTLVILVAFSKRWMIAKDLGGGFGEFVQVDAQATLVLTKTLCCRVR